MLSSARRVVALTGAGISVESGIPPFRGKGGLWEKLDPLEYAHIDAFLKNPAKIWEVMLKEMKEVIESAQPNEGHKGLARLERAGVLSTVITQNVDGLHQMAGNEDVIEFHGSFARYYCMECNAPGQIDRMDVDRLPPRCDCGGLLRPDCVFFGEAIPHDVLWRSQEAASRCDVMLVVGTSAIVHPAAYMPTIAKERGARIIEINLEPTPLTGYVSDETLLGKAGTVLRAITEEMGIRERQP